MGGGLNSHNDFYGRIVSLDNLFSAWREFKKGKIKKQDVERFALDLEEHIFALHKELGSGEYRHGPYSHFIICDPKRRHIHKARVKDRVLHHAIVRILEPIFDKTFIFDSFSSREEKGTHEAHKRFENFAWRLSRNNTRAVWSLKCDIKKFFDSMDHEMLLTLLAKKVDSKTLILLSKIVESFHVVSGKGLPIGNLTSQLFSNIYLNELDQFIKRRLRVKYYIRYADDFVILSADKEYLEGLLDPIGEYLQETLKLELHPNKIILRKWTQGIDFLGYVIFPFHKILRTKTKTRILKKMRKRTKEFEEGKITGYIHSQSLQSYLGMLKHCRGNTVSKDLEEIGKLK